MGQCVLFIGFSWDSPDFRGFFGELWCDARIYRVFFLLLYGHICHVMIVICNFCSVMTFLVVNYGVFALIFYRFYLSFDNYLGFCGDLWCVDRIYRFFFTTFWLHLLCYDWYFAQFWTVWLVFLVNCTMFTLMFYRFHLAFR